MLRQSVRRLVSRPGLTITAVVTLALAIGATTTIFSLLDAVALNPLPYPDSGRLIQIGAKAPGLVDLRPVSWPKFQMLEAGTHELRAVTAYTEVRASLTDTERPKEITGARVSPGFFDVWGVRPVMGRPFTAAEQKAGGAAVALVSYGLWQDRFLGASDVVGRTLDVDGLPTTVIGVLPDVLRFPFKDVDIWLPRPFDVSFLTRKAIDAGVGYLTIAGRLREGVAIGTAQKEIDRLAANYKAANPGHVDTTFPLVANPMAETLVGTTRRTLLLLLGAVAFVLLIACADVANLLLADGLSRKREVATRVALGASRSRVFGQVVRESLLISGAGGLLGVLLAYAGLKALVAGNPAELPRIDDVHLSVASLLVTFLVTCAAGVLASLAPAWQTLRSQPLELLAQGERAGGARSGRGPGLLVATQIALALVLLSATGLLVKSLGRVSSVPLGFAPDDLLFVQVTLPEAKYPGVAARRVFFDALLSRVRAIPGVRSASLVEYPPIGGAPHTKLTVVGQAPLPDDKQPLVLRAITASGYFETLGAHLVAGRDLDPAAPPDAPLTAVVNRSLARMFFEGQSPLGKRVKLRGGTTEAEIVGVVEDVKQQALEQPIEPMIFLAFHQTGSDLFPPNFMNLAIRTSVPLASVAGALRREVSAIDPGQPLAELTTMESLLKTATARRRLTTGLFSGFYALALALALLGIYGVAAHAVTLRRREIAVRMAVGASRRDVVREVLVLGTRWIAPGLFLGAAGAWAAGRALAGQLFEVAGVDAFNLARSAAVLGVVALLACLLPARRAARIDPAVALRTP